ncbi:MAG: type III-A CRISPR-associated protein Csm2 [Bdellovibrionota bacterium]|nr:type III-A CRISPR-associated protein Csm2 [Bdellovibrionota bacterium]
MPSNYNDGYNNRNLYDRNRGYSYQKRDLDECVREGFLEKENGIIKNTFLFSDTAKNVAELLQKTNMKTTQVRKFYDEFVHYADVVGDKNENIDRYLPAINMIYAKVCYAKTKPTSKVHQAFVDFIKLLIDEINKTKDLANAKLFFESVYAFLDL